MNTPAPAAALTKESFRSLSEGNLIQDADGNRWKVRRIEPIERDSNYPGPLKAFVRREDGTETMLLWDDVHNIVVGEDFQEIPEFNR